jgi:hypothetical protein
MMSPAPGAPFRELSVSLREPGAHATGLYDVARSGAPLKVSAFAQAAGYELVTFDKGLVKYKDVKCTILS